MHRRTVCAQEKLLLPGMHTDQQYITALRRNDPKGIREIYRLYAGQALRWVSQHHGTADDAKDIFQEAVLAVYEKAADPAFVLTCPLGALLHVIYSRKWMDRLRQKNRDGEVRKTGEQRYMEEAVAQADTLTVAEEVVAEEKRQKLLGQAFAELSELCRRLLTMLSEGTRPPEAAERLEMNSVDTLYRRKNACVQRWRAVYLELEKPES